MWTKIDNGAGGRISTCMVLDSKRILWIIYGAQNFDLYDVWSYNLTSDEYRLTYKASNGTKIFGTQGVPSPDVSPGTLTAHWCTIDSKDTIYIFSNSGTSASSFWTFNTTTWQFTWLYGDDSTVAAHDGVWPGSMTGTCLEVDAEDNLWIITGGSGSYYAPAVWKYTSASNTWTREYFVNDLTVTPVFDGPTPAYGTRLQASCTMDSTGKIWIFGGYGPVEGGNLNDFSPSWNDLWTFDTKNLQSPWQVQFGNSTSYNTPGYLSAPFEFHPDNAPASRYGAGHLVDRGDGTIMLYGGYGFYGTSQGSKEDFWLFNVTSKQWALASGGIELDDVTITDTRFTAAGNYAAARHNHAIAGGRHLRGDMIFYGGQTDSFFCYKDIWIVPQDQCALGISNCSPNADCTDTMFGFNCVCKQGYNGDGITCEIPQPQSTPGGGNVPQQQQPQTQQQPGNQQPQTSTGSALFATFGLISFLLFL